MTEKEKMLAGEQYLASDPELVADRLQARALMREYNATTETEADSRAAVLQKLFGSIGSGAEVEPPFFCDYGYNIHVGSRVSANYGCIILDCHRVDIGDDVLFGPYVQVYAAYHPTTRPPVSRSWSWQRR